MSKIVAHIDSRLPLFCFYQKGILRLPSICNCIVKGDSYSRQSSYNVQNDIQANQCMSGSVGHASLCNSLRTIYTGIFHPGYHISASSSWRDTEPLHTRGFNKSKSLSPISIPGLPMQTNGSFLIDMRQLNLIDAFVLFQKPLRLAVSQSQKIRA